MSNLKPIVGALLALAAATAFAQSQPAQVQARQANQQARISQGASTGALTPQETQRLEKEQAHITKAETKAEADGVVTTKESRHVHRMQERASKDIYRQKHDAKVVTPAAPAAPQK